MKHPTIPISNPKAGIDLNNPEKAKTAVELEWPETFSTRAKMVIRYLGNTAFLFSYDNSIVMTDETLALDNFGDGTPESPFRFPRYVDNTLEGVEAWLEEIADQFDSDACIEGWDDIKATFELENESKSEIAHIDKLRRHDVKLWVDGQTVDIPENLWRRAVAECLRNGYRAIMYEILLPETGEVLALAIHADGHVDSGNEQNVIYCMENH